MLFLKQPRYGILTYKTISRESPGFCHVTFKTVLKPPFSLISSCLPDNPRDYHVPWCTHQPVTGFCSFQMLMELKGPHVIPGHLLNLFLDEIPGLTCMTVCLFPSVTKELVSWMRGHESSVFSISVHGSGRYAITTSSDTAQLWDLDTFQRKRKLNILQSVGIQKVSGQSASWSVVLLRLVCGSAGYGCYK